MVRAEIIKYRAKSDIAGNLELYLEMIRLRPTGIIRIKNKIAPKLMKSESKTSKTIFVPMGIFMEFNQIRFEKEVIGTMSKVRINVASRYKEKFLNKIFTVQNFSMRKSHSIINPHYAQKFYFFNFSFI